ncbi:HAD-like domain-containing protein [Lipomyces oligophaga]|uniref:HAD-like domain-containing protein n=1 Tax=Lipomyces oligophaga TaxID=45792 RepID=UPI0034CE5DE8
MISASAAMGFGLARSLWALRSVAKSDACSLILRRRHLSSTSGHLDLGKNFAFAFDIDGVLVRGSKAIEEGKQALRLLQEHKIPWILLTNGGGKTEAERVAGLSRELGIKISEDQFIQSHTPFKRLVNTYDKVLVSGGDGDKCRHVAQTYGFKDCVTSVDLIALNPTIWPFHRFTAADMKRAQSLSDSPFDAVLVFNDPRDWGCEAQIIIDILTSQAGKFGTKNPTLDQTVPIYFSNNDLLWANEYHLPRFGQGAFRTSIEKLFLDYTGTPLESTIIGKPFLFTYEYAHSFLNEWRKSAFGYTEDVQRVYMVGDNPASDIRGGNSYGWSTLLVKTGVYQEGDHLDAKSKPRATVANVLEAVLYAIEHEHELSLRK